MAFTDLGSLGATGSSGNNQSSLALTTAAACAVGELVVVVVADDNLGTGADADGGEVASITDSGGNAWTKGKGWTLTTGVSQAGAHVSLWYSFLKFPIANGGLITAFFLDSGTSDATGLTARHFSVAAGNTIAVEGTPGSRTDTAADPGSLDVTTANIACLRIRGIGGEVGNNTSLTQTASWTPWANGNSATTGTTAEMCARAEHIISTATGAASNPTWASCDNASVYVAFKEVPQPPRNLARNVANTVLASWVAALPLPQQGKHLSPETPAVAATPDKAPGTSRLRIVSVDDAPLPPTNRKLAQEVLVTPDSPPGSARGRIVSVPDDPLPPTNRKLVQPFVADNAPGVRAWYSTVLNAWVAVDPAPQQYRKLVQGIDNPPFGAKRLAYSDSPSTALPQTNRKLVQEVITAADAPPPRRVTISIPALEVSSAYWQQPRYKAPIADAVVVTPDSPPGSARGRVVSVDDAPLPPTTRKLVQSFVAPAADNPPGVRGYSNVLRAWAVADPPSQTSRKLGALLGTVVDQIDQPPGSARARVVALDDQPLPPTRRKLGALLGTVVAQVDDPPFSHKRFVWGEGSPVVTAITGGGLVQEVPEEPEPGEVSDPPGSARSKIVALADPPLPPTNKKLGALLGTVVLQVDNPPFGQKKFHWGDGAPTVTTITGGGLVQDEPVAGPVSDPPGSNRSRIIAVEDPPLPPTNKKLGALLGTVVLQIDNPPFGQFRSKDPWRAWVADPLPQLRAKLPPSLLDNTPQIDSPPGASRARIVGVEDGPLPPVRRKLPQSFVADNPPFGQYRSKDPWRSWVGEALLPSNKKLPQTFVPDNPPFGQYRSKDPWRPWADDPQPQLTRKKLNGDQYGPAGEVFPEQPPAPTVGGGIHEIRQTHIRRLRGDGETEEQQRARVHAEMDANEPQKPEVKAEVKPEAPKPTSKRRYTKIDEAPWDELRASIAKLQAVAEQDFVTNVGTKVAETASDLLQQQRLDDEDALAAILMAELL